MMNHLRNFYTEWKDTGTGKAVRDFLWSVAASAVTAGGLAATDAILAGEQDPRIFLALFYVGCLTGASKAISYGIKQYRSDRPMTPS